MLKKQGTTTTRYVYDGPNLLHEQTGSVKRDYIYLQGEVVGAVINNTLYYVHNDHLGRPQAITNLSQQKVWEAENNAFGSLPVLDAINGFNIGFPGQYYDSESGTWYNYFRTYDASSGRYLQSDPIGLAGGLNTYSYAAANPLRYIDPYGLDLGDHRNRNIGIASGCAAGAAAGAIACAAAGPGYPICEVGVIVCACSGGAILGGIFGVGADAAESSNSNDNSSESPRPDVSGNPTQPDPDDDDTDTTISPQIAKIEKQLEQHGRPSVEKSLRSLESRAAEARQQIETYKAQGGYTSSVERELRAFEAEIQAIRTVLGRGP